MSTRRNLLTTAAASLGLPGAVITSSEYARPLGILPDLRPDAELIAMAERFIVDEQAIRDWPCSADGNLPPEFNNAVMAQGVLASQMGALRATTAEGVAARARCLAAHNLELDFAMDDPDTVTGRLVHYLMRDAAALSVGAPSKARTVPDAELLEACAAFDALERAYLATGFGYKPYSAEAEAAEIERDRISAAQKPLVARMWEMQAITLEGQVARARSYALWDAELMKPQDDIEGLFKQAIVRDLLAGRGVA